MDKEIIEKAIYDFLNLYDLKKDALNFEEIRKRLGYGKIEFRKFMTFCRDEKKYITISGSSVKITNEGWDYLLNYKKEQERDEEKREIEGRLVRLNQITIIIATISVIIAIISTFAFGLSVIINAYGMAPIVYNVIDEECENPFNPLKEEILFINPGRPTIIEYKIYGNNILVKEGVDTVPHNLDRAGYIDKGFSEFFPKHSTNILDRIKLTFGIVINDTNKDHAAYVIYYEYNTWAYGIFPPKLPFFSSDIENATIKNCVYKNNNGIFELTKEDVPLC